MEGDQLAAAQVTAGTGQPTFDASYRAAIFDVDAVTDAADLHAAAWRSLFETFLPPLGHATVSPSSGRQDYRNRPHASSSEDVIRALVKAYDVRLAEGQSSDPPGALTVHGLAARKRELFAELVSAHGIITMPSSAALLERLRSSGIKTALVAGCHESDSVLPLSGVAELFDTVLCQMRLTGTIKPRAWRTCFGMPSDGCTPMRAVPL